MKIQESAENYLETILMIRERKEIVRSIDIVREMNFSKPSVSVAMKNLKESGYITMDETGRIYLTEKGEGLATKIYDRHVKVSQWLASIGVPKEIKNNFEYYLNWLDDWACSRKVGLGTRLPWDNQWLIEPLSDSTIYMSYYTIAKYLRDMDPDDLNLAFFDKVLLNKDSGEITVPSEKVQEIQDEFNYWYPLDWRLSAKDLVGNHLSFLMFHHSAIYPEEKWPRGTVVFGMGLLEGNKMSSSKGNVVLLKDAIRDYSADVVRLFLMASAEPWQDFDWREKEVLGTKRRLEWFREFAAKVEEVKGSPLDLSNIEEVELTRTIDLWMISQLNQHIKNATEALEVFQTRQALQDSLFLLKKDVDHYLYRVKHIIDKQDPGVIYVLSTVLEAWIRLLAPFTPHTCEELWSTYGGVGFASEASWPEYDDELVSAEIEKSEDLVENIIKDIAHIKQMVGEDVEKVHIYLAPEWKWELYKIADEVGKPDIGQIMGRAIGAKLHDDKKEIAMVAKKIGKEITKTRYIGKINEEEILSDALEYIKEECGNEVIIHVDDSYDPQNKAKNAMPYKPAIFMESIGIYHIALFHYLKKFFNNVFIINPLITNSNQNSSIRKVKNDKKNIYTYIPLGTPCRVAGSRLLLGGNFVA